VKELETPKVTVLMSLYNEERSVAHAIQSILAQTYTDFEFLIIDDGSTDGSKAVVDSFDDPRIRLVSRPNKGLTPSLNEGIGLAHGAYIARQDADDVSMPTRLEREVALLDRRRLPLSSPIRMTSPLQRLSRISSGMALW